MTSCKLNSLENFPKNAKLTRVVLTDNFLAGSELKHLSDQTQITTLKLGGNKIKSLDEL